VTAEAAFWGQKHMFPKPYVQTFEYTSFAQGLGDGSFPGVQLDADLAGIKQATDTLDQFLMGAFRSDGRLQNGSVRREALSSDIQLGLAPPVPWAAGVFFRKGDTVTNGAALFFALADHTSDNFAADLAAQFWQLIVTFTTIGFLGDNSVATNNIVDAAVTAEKLAPNSVTSAAIAPGSVTAAALAANFGVIPIGTEVNFAGIQLPAGFLWEDGKAYARVGDFAPLFNALTLPTTADATAGNIVLANVPVDLTPLGPTALVGAIIEGVGVAPGATVVSYTSNSITMSAAGVGNITGSAIRLFPHGNGDGATTFNVPNYKGRADIGRDDMGGTAANVITTAFSARAGALGSTGGEQQHALTSDENGPHVHGTTEHPHVHGTTEQPHVHGYQRYSGSIGVSEGSSNPQTAGTDVGDSTSAAVTGLSVNGATTGLTVNSSGSGTAHNNMQPSRVTNKIIFAGV
jgi:microcystin-dependent protein